MESIFLRLIKRLGMGCFLVATGAFLITIVKPINAKNNKTTYSTSNFIIKIREYNKKNNILNMT